jgi:hypothetical protein
MVAMSLVLSLLAPSLPALLHGLQHLVGASASAGSSEEGSRRQDNVPPEESSESESEEREDRLDSEMEPPDGILLAALPAPRASETMTGRAAEACSRRLQPSLSPETPPPRA